MEVSQIYSIMNSVTDEILGSSEIVTEDLSNVVDIGTAIFNANAIDNYVRSLVNHIGRVIFVNRPYSGSIPSIMRDSWEFGSVLEKIQAELPDAEENESWELQDGAVYSNEIYYKPIVTAKFYNSKTTFEIPMSFAQKQVKESFNSLAQLNGFISMIYTAVENSMTIKVDALVMRCVNTLIAETVYNDFDAAGESDYGAASGIKAVNLLYLYNEEHTGSEITAAESIKNPDFLKFAAYQMSLYIDRLKKMSRLFNVGGKARFTPTSDLIVVMLSDFKKAANIYLQSDTFNEEYTALPNSDTVPYWQGSGTEYDFDSVSAINIKTPSNNTVEITGVLGVMFDKNATMVCNTDKRVTTAWNAKGEFYNNYYKFDESYFIDTNENAVVFFVADEETA